MRNLEREIIEYLDGQEKPISMQEMFENQAFDGITNRILTKKLLELVLSKVICRNINDGIAYYFIEKTDKKISLKGNANDYKRLVDNNVIEQNHMLKDDIMENSDNYIKNERIEDIIIRTYNVESEEIEKIKENEEYEENAYDEFEIERESIEGEERKKLEEVLKLSFENNTKLLTFKEYRVNLPDKFIVENEANDYWYAWIPNQEYPEDINKAIMVIYSSDEDKDNLGVKIYNQQIWEIAQEFVFWYSKINKKEEYDIVNYFPVVAKYTSGGCTFAEKEHKYEYILNIHINNIYKKFIIHINKGFKENEVQVEQMILNFANAIIPTSMVLPLEEIDSRYFVEKKLTTELLKEWKECFEIRLNENKTIINQRIEVEKMKLQYEKSIGILNMDGKVQIIKNVLKAHLEKCEEYFYQAINYIEKVSKTESNNQLLENLYDITNNIMDKNFEYVYRDEKSTIIERIKNYEEIKMRLITPEIEKIIEENKQRPYIINELVDKLQMLIQVKNDNKRKREEIKNSIIQLENNNKVLNRLIDDNEQELIKIEKNIKILNEKNDRQKEIANDKVANNEEVKEKITKLNEEIATKKGSLKVYEKEVNNIEKEVEKLSMLSFIRKKSLTEQLQIYNNNIKNINEEIEKLNAEKNLISNAINIEMTKENEKIKEIEKKINEEQANKEYYQVELENKKIQLANNKKKINDLLEEQRRLII